MALKQREQVQGGITMPTGDTAIAANSVCKIDSSTLIVATASTEASAIFVLTGDVATAGGDPVAIARPGDIVMVNAADGDLAEGEWWIPAADGQVDSIVTLSTASQYVLGLGLQASSAQGQKVAMFYCPHIATKSAS